MADRHDEFYVGYLPLPQRIGRFIRPTTAALLALMLAAAVALASQQRDPGAGQWTLGQVVELSAVVDVAPYPLLFIDDGGVWRASLVVEQGKRVAERLQDHDGKIVTLSGVWLERDGMRMFELASDEPRPQANASERPWRSAAAGEPMTLNGEVIDPKCYLGAMKPGDGKTHKGCAALCLAGGIPPMLRVVDADGSVTLYLLVGQQGQAIGRDLIPIVGEPVEVTGVREPWGNLAVLRVDPGAVRVR